MRPLAGKLHAVASAMTSVIGSAASATASAWGAGATPDNFEIRGADR